jgi:glucokinase
MSWVDKEGEMETVLAGDIGGTKTTLGFFVMGPDRPEAVVSQVYASAETTSLEELIARLLSEHPHTVTSACLGIAGPVMHGTVKATNLPWQVSEAAMSKQFGWRHVRLVNDLTATAYAVPFLRDDETLSLNTGKGDRKGNIGIVAPGTGLGVAVVVAEAQCVHVVASEGGHADFAPADDRQVKLWRHLRRDLDHVSVERVLSGSGLHAIYQWLKEESEQPEPDWLRQQLYREDPAKVISEVALNDSDAVCGEALKVFVSVLGAYSGNLALTAMTTGGIYLGGGITPKILPKLQIGPFMEAFTAKGRFEQLLSKIPVRVILNEKAALLGAAWCALHTNLSAPTLNW